MAGALAGRRILVTRPVDQAGELSRLIEAAGGEAVRFPVLEITDIDDLAPLLGLIDRLDAFDLAIFISPNAVNKAMNLVAGRRAWPKHLRAAAIGRASEKELRRYGLDGVIAPQGRFDSEALLELPEMQEAAVRGRRVAIFRGDGGRELLGDTLAARGATVEYGECYRRGRPSADAGPLLRRWARGEIDAVTVTSSEGLRNLYDMLGKLGQSWLARTPLFAPHERIVEAAKALGVRTATVAGSGDAGLVAALAAHFSDERGKDDDAGQ